jgi:N-acetylneuraminic acid mutarotase
VIGNTLYVFGGKTGADSVTDSIYSYNIAAKKWSGVGKMLQPRYNFQAVSVNGSAYLLGGYSSDDDVLPLQSIELFDPTIGQMTQTAIGPVDDRCNFAASAVNGSIYVFGGIGSSTNTDSVLTSGSMYDPVSRHWTPIRSLQQARYCFSAEVISGRIYCVGGATGPFDKPVAEKSTLIYYP